MFTLALVYHFEITAFKQVLCGRWRYIHFPMRLHSQYIVDFYEIVCKTFGSLSLKVFIMISYHIDTLSDGFEFIHVFFKFEVRIIYPIV